MTERCPNCGDDCWRDEADVGVGIMYGPWGCPSCGWSEWAEYNQLNGPTSTGGYATDQWGGLYPTIPAAPGARDSDSARARMNK